IEFRAATVNIFRSNLAAVGFDDRANNRQSHPESFILSGKELLEQPLPRFLTNANAVIADSDRNFAITGAPGLVFALALLARGLVLRVNVVAIEITNDLSISPW